MAQQIKSITNPKISLNILSSAEVQRIHTATLEVIESVGVHFPSAKALDILEAHGAQVDRSSMIARIPGAIMEQFLKLMPPAYTLAALDPALDLPLDGNHSHLGTDGCGVEILDAFTGEKRRTTKKDVADIARVADYLDSIAFHWVPISAQDCPPESRNLHELAAIWEVSKKHVQTESIVTESEMRAAVEMAAVLAGGLEASRQRPLLSIMQCTLSTLCHDGGSLEAGLEQETRHHTQRVAGLQGRLQALSPEHVLQRGYSITRCDGYPGALRDPGAVRAGDQLVTTLAAGTIRSVAE